LDLVKASMISRNIIPHQFAIKKDVYQSKEST
jgi:hypothetical protein